MDTTLRLTVDRDQPRGLIDLPLRDPPPGRGIVYGVVMGALIWLALGVLVLVVRAAMGWLA